MGQHLKMMLIDDGGEHPFPSYFDIEVICFLFVHPQTEHLRFWFGEVKPISGNEK